MICRKAIQHNVLGAKALADLAERMLHLESYVHVSTAFSFCERMNVEEKLYPMKYDPEALINLLETTDDETILNKLEPILLENRPNTYTFTKALAEHMIHRRAVSGPRLPATIGRPGIVTWSIAEPVPGFSDSLNGPVGACTLATIGLARTGVVDYSKIVEGIPVDFTSNALITIAWENAVKRQERRRRQEATLPTSCPPPLPSTSSATNTTTHASSDQTVDLEEDFKVYHITAGSMMKMTWGDYFKQGEKIIHKYPPCKTVRPLATVPDKQTLLRVRLTQIFSELLFAYLLDFLIGLSGNKKL